MSTDEGLKDASSYLSGMTKFPEHAVLLSFEGPDPYAMIGGLGIRMTELASALAKGGVQTRLMFVGDPAAPPTQRTADGVEYFRCCQQVSSKHPASVYDGEHEKISEYARITPGFVSDQIVAPAFARGERVLVMAEGWYTAPAVIELDRLLRERNLRAATTIVWNAGTTYGLEMIDWTALCSAALITTVSRSMKFALEHFGVGALVIPNGIPERLIAGPDPKLRAALREACKRRPLFLKIGRFDPDKRWLSAIDAFAEVRSVFPQALFVMRGGREPYAGEVFARLRHHGLDVRELIVQPGNHAEFLAAIAETTAPILDLRNYIDEDILRALYAEADAVLANSGKESFGLVGLEVMAAGGLAVCGSTGEDYAESFVNAVVCDTADGCELATYLIEIFGQPDGMQSLRENGAATARRYLWPTILRILQRKLAYGERIGGTSRGPH
ncbi:MAG TPA: glycosyltransferase family 4 protein [Candidatus Baltobacteraceae bacterium]|jgi:glycosyltransferase involved in cell wall biosynthesis|nr:glycosyltransferase family 4 protein [Candidatus Baltobacteraceae bacterium]